MTGDVPSLFITGTDTGIGKTVLTATLTACLRRLGLPAIPMKPFQTGAVPDGTGGFRSPDLDLALLWSGLEELPVPYSTLAPYCFEPACSPHLAATQAGVQPTLEEVRNAYLLATGQGQPILCEGAGGVRVPVNADQDMCDLMVHLGLPALVAARPSLGTLNHTLLTLEALRVHGIPVLGVVLICSTAGDWGDIEADNVKTIERRGRTEVLGVLPHVAGLMAQLELPEVLYQEGLAVLQRLAANR